ncbi:hypothetical protein ACTMTJ_15960 [Phytohabitans sp. LJ34]|uniref:hypothetical protein n=1 Tax=Phytohabitans sp. LJ34 TaxID=3452217 RepID=UPI003F8AFB86
MSIRQSPVVAALGQIVVTGLVATVLAPFAMLLALAAVMAFAPLVVVHIFLVLLALFGVGAATKDGSPLTATPGPRVVWTLLVVLGGVGLAALGWVSLRDSELVPVGDLRVGLPLVGVAFALVAAVLTRPWAVRIAGGVLILAVVVVFSAG